MNLEAMMPNSVLLDTSFFLRFLNDEDPLFSNSDNYYKYFLSKDIEMLVSTVSIGEYCVGGSSDELPLRNLRILPFNYNHSIKAGEFGKILFEKRRIGQLEVSDRVIIPNDAQLFSQADVEESVLYYLTSDTRSIKLFNSIKEEIVPNFEIIDLNNPHTEVFGLLDL